MSTFGYHKELGKYEEVDEDELLATLTSEEIQELESELAAIDPDDNIPIGLRQRDQTAKTPTGSFSREALLKYWEDETMKLLEDENSDLPTSKGSLEEQPHDKRDEQHGTEKDATRSENKRSNAVEKNTFGNREGKDVGGVTEKDVHIEKKDKCKKEPLPTSDRHGKSVGNSLPRHSEKGPGKNRRSETTEHNLNGTADGPCENPIVIDEALEKILRDDPTMSELNLNNIEDISQETLLRFAEALSTNTHVHIFSLANTHADDRVAFAISKMLMENRSITNLNIESNFVSGRGILALLTSLHHNGTLVELRFHNQRHICGGQVEMEMVRLLRDNTTLLKLGYQFDLPGPRMTATSILTRNQDQQRQRRLQQQRERAPPEAPLTQSAEVSGTKSPAQVSGTKPANRSQQKSLASSAKLVHSDQTLKKVAPPPPPAFQPHSEKNTSTRKIAEMIKHQEGSNSTKGPPGQKKSKSKKGKNGANEKESTDILKDLKKALKPSQPKRKDEPCRPLAPQRSTRDDLMEAIRGSSIRSLKRVNPS